MTFFCYIVVSGGLFVEKTALAKIIVEELI